jgi:4-alpha-glucanotransferase
MEIRFNIEYQTLWGQSLRIVYNEDDKSDLWIYLECKTTDGILWYADLNVDAKTIRYKYQLLQNGIHEEGPLERKLDLSSFYDKRQFLNIKDTWRSPQNSQNIFLTAAFEKVFFSRENIKNNIKNIKGNLIVNLLCPNVPRDKTLGIVGNTESLGNWSKPIVLSDENFPLWSVGLNIDPQFTSLEYKFVLLDLKDHSIVKWEEGHNRKAVINPFTDTLINEEGFKYGGNWWRSSGVAIPIFSMRTKEGFGIGEFHDLKAMIDLASAIKMGLIQTLPVNDTIANKSWTDSYPYAAISVYALHPLYIHIPSITDISKYDWFHEYEAMKQELNNLKVIDFEKVLEAKTKYIGLLYKHLGAKALKSPEVKKFINENEWIKSYSIFSHLRDVYGSPDFNKWGKYSIFNESIIKEFWTDKAIQNEVGFYVFLQYHLDKQLREAGTYGQEKGVVLKGDLPIGIYRFSCDAWTNPELYNMDQQAGAPPDDYAVDGQNWGFPTYNWEEMSKDGFGWWKSRMSQLSKYFDALRIDHILGFFRIWSIPMNQSSGTLGLFYPRLPYHIDELQRTGIHGSIDRFTKPYLRSHLLLEIFGSELNEVVNTFLIEVFKDAYIFKSEFDNQSKIIIAIDQGDLSQFSSLKSKIVNLHTEVLLIEEPGSNGLYFNPRITIGTTRSYQELDQQNKWAIDAIYNEYFFTRHNEYWKDQAYMKLPALLKASDMFICGEDLGMIPATVPQVMTNLNIIPLEIQRMSKTNTEFGDCKNYSYHTVCSPSCHDMSTIRGWWESSHALAKSFYRNYMGMYSEAPIKCSTDIVEYVVQDHLHSPSMLAIFPIQDLLGIDSTLRLEDPIAEQINEPSNPKHYWRYRLHLNIEDIIVNENFCNRIKSMVEESGRA